MKLLKGQDGGFCKRTPAHKHRHGKGAWSVTRGSKSREKKNLHGEKKGLWRENKRTLQRENTFLVTEREEGSWDKGPKGGKKNFF